MKKNHWYQPGHIYNPTYWGSQSFGVKVIKDKRIDIDSIRVRR